MKCKDCTITSCPNRGSNAVFSKPCTIINLDSFDCQSFRNQVAKDILCAMIINEGVADERNVDNFTKDNQVKDAVLYADKLISKLKEKEVRNETNYRRLL